MQPYYKHPYFDSSKPLKDTEENFNKILDYRKNCKGILTDEEHYALAQCEFNIIKRMSAYDFNSNNAISAKIDFEKTGVKTPDMEKLILLQPIHYSMRVCPADAKTFNSICDKIPKPYSDFYRDLKSMNMELYFQMILNMRKYTQKRFLMADNHDKQYHFHAA